MTAGSLGDSRTVPRMPALDALRGVAALVVVLHHLTQFWHRAFPAHAQGFLERALTGVGHIAVVLFFVLSGFVLMLAHHSSRDTSFSPFVVRRIFRLYPAFLAAFAGAHLLNAVQSFIDAPVSLEGIIRDASLLFARENDLQVDVVAWSLTQEMRFSLLFPLLVVVVLRWPRMTAAASVVIYVAVHLSLRHLGNASDVYLPNDWRSNVLSTLLYLPVFLVGMIAARWRLEREATWKPAAWASVVAVGSFMLLLLAGKAVRDDLLFGLICGALILAASGSSPLSAALDSAPFRWLGRISYSLYLVHFPLLALLFHGASSVRAGVVAALSGVILSLALATLLERTLERPAIAWGRAAADRVRRRAGKKESGS